ncbi:MAG: MarR family transcriptional regulator [Dysgonamonadaceae bacterium]|jgi:DNA-binding MarR family transcriptional regulator|nr:MarR family transcriptional regulator [Dysgonamonadaceae bacterium]
MKTDLDTESRAALLTAIEKMKREHEWAVTALDDIIVEKLNINKTDLRILDVLIDGSATPSDLAKKTTLTPSAMTSALDRLEAKKFIVRNRDLHDRRKIIIEPTALIKRLNQILYTPILLDENKALSKLCTGELKIIYDYLCSEKEINSKNRQRLIKEKDSELH